MKKKCIVSNGKLLQNNLTVFIPNKLWYPTKHDNCMNY